MRLPVTHRPNTSGALTLVVPSDAGNCQVLIRDSKQEASSGNAGSIPCVSTAPTVPEGSTVIVAMIVARVETPSARVERARSQQTRSLAFESPTMRSIVALSNTRWGSDPACAGPLRWMSHHFTPIAKSPTRASRPRRCNQFPEVRRWASEAFESGFTELIRQSWQRPRRSASPQNVIDAARLAPKIHTNGFGGHAYVVDSP